MKGQRWLLPAVVATSLIVGAGALWRYLTAAEAGSDAVGIIMRTTPDLGLTDPFTASTTLIAAVLTVVAVVIVGLLLVTRWRLCYGLAAAWSGIAVFALVTQLLPIDASLRQWHVIASPPVEILNVVVGGASAICLAGSILGWVLSPTHLDWRSVTPIDHVLMPPPTHQN
jgi:hypothetical protein